MTIIIDPNNGVQMPSLTTTAKNAIVSPLTGAVVFDTTLGKLSAYTGAAWADAGGLLSYIRLNTANGYGSTNTVIRRFTNVVNNVGSDITYADSATLGGTLTINTTGIYSACYNDQFSGVNHLGLSLNSSQLTTNIRLINIADILSASTAGIVDISFLTSATFFATAGSVVRAHTSGISSGISTTMCQLTIARVA